MAYQRKINPAWSVAGDAQYIADFYYVKEQIFKMCEEMSDIKADVFDRVLNGRNKLKLESKIRKLNKSIFRLYYFIRPKLTVTKSEDILDSVKILEDCLKNQRTMSWEEADVVSLSIIDWLERSGLTRIDIEIDDPVKQLEDECY